jgi:hypothetical protein
VFDINDLRDKIKNLKIQKAELQQTADNLGREIEVKSSRLREARHERLQVDPDPDLRLRLADTASVLDDTHDIDDQRFRIANEKIEMQILMQEIRGSLPILEREVRHREAIAFHGKKTAAKLTKAVEKSQSLTPTIWNSVEDMKQSLKDAMDLLILSKTTWANILESEKSKNTSLSETVANRRKELARLMRDRDQLRNAIAQIDQQWRSERFRQQLVREEHITLRENLRRFHGGFGFQVCRQLNFNFCLIFMYDFFLFFCFQIQPSIYQTEAFLKETGGDASARLSLLRAAAALRPWLLPLDEPALKRTLSDSSASWLTEEVLLEQLQLMQSEMSAVPSKQSLRSSHSNLVASQSGKSLHNGIITSPNKHSRASLDGMDAFRYFDVEEGDDVGKQDHKPEAVLLLTYQSGEETQENNEEREEEAVEVPRLKLDVNRNMQIDLRTFCLLCDRLIIVYDA